MAFISSGAQGGLITPCSIQVFPNTELADPDYLQRFGMQTRIIELQEIHGRVRTPEWVAEEEEIVVATSAMPADDWARALRFSWVTMTMHSLKLGFYLMAWLVDRCGARHSEFLQFLAEGDFPAADFPRWSAQLAAFSSKIEALRAGQGRGCVLPDYGDIYWDEEEACFLRLSKDFDGFFAELRDLVLEFLERRGVAVSIAELDDVLAYQSLVIPRPDGRSSQRARFEHDLPAWFDALFATEPQPLRRTPTVVEANQPDFAGELGRFARETILWGRKSGTMLAQLRVETQAAADEAALV